jgi:inorganic phosphate transporter, PiT family
MIWLAYALVAVALAFAVSIGAHYTGACMGMPYAAGALRPAQALLIMAPAALLGAVFASGRVETTVGHGILRASQVDYGLALAIVASALVLTSLYNFATLPTSTIHILVFSTVGAGLAAGVPVDWGTIETLLVLWVVAPFAAFGLGYLLTRAADRRWSPGSGFGALARPAVWGLTAVGTAASFAMGANDVSNATGSFVMTGLFGLGTAALVGGIGLAAGVLTWGRPLLEKVAFRIVRLDPQMAIASQVAQAGVVLAYTAFGYFTSMNQALVGAMIGAGTARGEHTVLRRPVGEIALGWALGPVSGLALGFALATLVGRVGFA